MSRMGKVPIAPPGGAKVKVDRNVLKVTGPKGELCFAFKPFIKIKDDNGSYWVERLNDSKQARSHQGLVHRLFKNMIKGVTDGFSKTLELVGVGYKAEVTGKSLTINIGFCHPVIYDIPEDVQVNVDKNFINISGIDKQRVGQVAAEIRSIRKPDAYKGKGIRYKGEHIRIKPGKAAVGAGF